MGRVHDQDGVEFVADARPRLHVAHAGQQERRQHVAVGRALPHPRGHLLQQPFARGFLQQADERLDPGLEPHHLRVEGGLAGRDRLESGQEAQVAKAEDRAAGRGRSHEGPAICSHAHGCSCSQE